MYTKGTWRMRANRGWGLGTRLPPPLHESLGTSLTSVAHSCLPQLQASEVPWMWKERSYIVKMKGVEKGALHGTARPSAPLHGKRPGGGRSRHLLDMWAAHNSAPQNPTPVSLLVRN